jgi:hypothetical protein
VLNLRSHFAAALSIGLVALAVTWKASAEIKLPNVLSDHGVLQREAPVRVWGWATPGARLTVSFHAQTLAAAAKSHGFWIHFSKLTAESRNIFVINDLFRLDDR